MARLAPALAARFPASLASADSLDICLDKGRFADTLARLGLPHPRTIPIGTPRDVRRLWDSSLRDPFLKPRNSRAFQARYGVKAFRIRTRAEAIARVREARRAGLELLLQEYVPGAADCHYFIDGFVDRGGSLCARFARRRIRTFPEPFGDSSCMVTIPLDQARAPLGILNRLLPALQYRGVFNAQFKYDDRDGLIKLLEINPRPWGGVSLAVRCGVDVVRMAYEDALDLPVQPTREYPVGRYWVYPSRDRLVCWRLLRDGRLTPGAWIRSWTGAVQPVFRWDDPVPAMVAFLHRIGRAIRRRLRGRSHRVRAPEGGHAGDAPRHVTRAEPPDSGSRATERRASGSPLQ
ncbi:MAG: ATP-grasp domain-containing protein [Candidatus Rokuibacteriota bacterium]